MSPRWVNSLQPARVTRWGGMISTPDAVQYRAYLVPAELLFRIDRPKETHSVGRD